MKKDRRISSIQRTGALETAVYCLLMLAMFVFAIMDSNGEGTGYFLVSTVVAMAGIHTRSEIRHMRIEAIRRQNAERAERAGLDMPWLYENTEDIREAVHAMRFKKGPPS